MLPNIYSVTTISVTTPHIFHYLYFNFINNEFFVSYFSVSSTPSIPAATCLDIIEVQLESSHLLEVVGVESDVQIVGGGHKVHPCRRELVTTHFHTEVVLETFNLHVIVDALEGVLNLERLVGDKNSFADRSRNPELAMVVGGVLGWVVW